MARLALMISLAFLAACATLPEGMTALDSDDRIVYRLPADQIDRTAALWGLNLKGSSYEYTTSRFKCRRTTRITVTPGGQCEVTLHTVMTPLGSKGRKARGALGSDVPAASSRKYLFGIDRHREGGVAILQFRPFCATRKTSSIDTLESAMEALATSGSFSYSIVLNSSQSPDAIRGNFRRFCKEQASGSSYVLLSAGKSLATFYLSLKPEGSGAKGVVLATVPLVPDGNYQVDGIDKAADTRHLVMDIIDTR